ncbi:MAG: HNH endonuclease [Candidatus Binatia bacterium]
MNTILLAWNPDRFPWGNLQDELAEARRHGRTTERWSVGNRRSLDKRTRFFLIRLGTEPRGLVGSGWTTSEPYDDQHWDLDRATRGEAARYVDIAFDVLEEHPLISMEELHRPPLAEMHWSTQMSGIEIPAAVAKDLETLWGQRSAKSNPGGFEELSTIGLMTEKHAIKVYVNRYERSASARALCLAHHGMTCAACSTLMSDVYGSAADNLIHVHHLTPLAGIPEGFQIDPVKDLRPVCPNCHAVIHSRHPPYSVEEVAQMIGTRKEKC